MMSDPRPVPRSRRSERRQGAPAPNARPRARFPWKTAAVLALLLIAAVLALRASQGKRADLVRQREEEAAAYDRLVSRHTVDSTKPWIEKYALQNGIEPAFAAAVILRESSYDPAATSSLGARGLMQVMENTFDFVRRSLNENADFADMYDAETNIRYGCWYLGYLCRMFDGDPIDMACAYHAGPNNVKLWIMNYAADQKHLKLDEIPMEDTRAYAGKVYDAYSVYFQHFYPDPV